MLVAYAGWSESEQLALRTGAPGCSTRMQAWQSSLSSWIQDVGPGRLGAIAAVVIVPVVVVAMLLRRGSQAAQS